MSPRRLASGCVLALALLGGRASHAELAVVVQGDPHCPSADMVHAALKDIYPEAAWLSQTAIVNVSGERLSLFLGEAQGAPREIPAPPNCQARAEIIALMIRAWSGDLPSQPTNAPVLTASATPSPAPPELSAHVFELDGAVFYSPLWGHAPGIWLALGRTPRPGGLGLRAFGAYQSARDRTLAGGKNHIARLLVGAGPTLHLQGESLFASVDAGLLVTFTRAIGDGYQTDEDTQTWNLGAGADVRGGVRLGRWRFWLNTRLLRLFHQETITIARSGSMDTDSQTLKALDLQIGIGVGERFE